MQVTHQEDHVTHAVIGGAKAIDFGISDSAEFFNILSSTLYSDQQLAVIRETLCNAWDAHIDASIIDKPIHITLTEEELIIRDFGKGIPKHLIGSVYGTYGGSTKKNDKGVTGGFGLGCKAPFAYTDHFEVTSWSEGEKTIYALSKSNAEVGGKPSIMPIIDIPTDETGLQVKIRLKNRNDIYRFRQLIERIVYNGEMEAILNDTKLETFPFSKSEHGYTIINSRGLIETDHAILIRYGNVIYPIESEEAYAAQYNKIKSMLNFISGRSHYSSFHGDGNHKIVFQAKPDTISVTPSRESLSMQTHTIKTITEILDKFLNRHNNEIQTELRKHIPKTVKMVHMNMTHKHFFEPSRRLLLGQDNKNLVRNVITNTNQYASHYLSRKYPDDIIGFHKRDTKARLTSLIEAGIGDRGLIQSYTALLRKNYSAYQEHKYVSAWFQRRVISRLYNKLKEDESVDHRKLFVYTDSKRNRWDNTQYGFEDPIKFNPTVATNCLPFLRNIIILSYNRIGIGERANQFPLMKWLGSAINSLVYIVPRNSAKVEAAREFFAKTGMYVLDLTKKGSWERETVTEPITREALESRPKLVGIPRFNIIVNDNGGISTERINLFGGVSDNRIENPEFVCKFSNKNDRNNIDLFTTACTKILTEFYGSRGGFVINSNQEAKYVNNGAKHFYDFVWEDILNEFETNPRIIESLPFISDIGDFDYRYRYKNRMDDNIEAIYYDQDLIEYFGIIYTLNNRDKKIINLFKELCKNMHNYIMHNDDLNKKAIQIKNKITNLKLDQILIDLDNQIKLSDNLRILDSNEFERIMKMKAELPWQIQKKDRVRNLFVELLEG